MRAMGCKTGVIIVQLKSDLCAASGDGFSSGIDIDICFGNNGLPLIPARRLKGCLREGATLLYPDGGNERDGRIDHLFGVAGGSEGGSLHIGDATIRELGGKPVEQRLGPDGRVGADTLRRLVGERAQTSMNDDGTAKKNSLRFVRIVHRTDPWAADGRQSLTFVADVSFDAKDRTLLADACKATRNIGLMRNRGFGAVRMELGLARAQGKRKAANAARLPRGTKRFSYRVRLDTPLMLPQRKGSEGLEYVPGTSVLGFFAGRMRGSKLFDELFLQGKVRFSALHPVGADNKRCTPAPTFVGRVKGGKHDGKYLLLGDVEKSADKAALKPLRGGFVDSNLHPVDMRTEIVYHHSRQGEGTLYTQHCLSAGQELAGVVESDDPKLLAALAAELSQADQDGGIRFGRSKTAQYSRCSLVSGPERDRASQVQAVRRGERLAYRCDSNVLIMGQNGSYSTDFSELVRNLRLALGKMADVLPDAGELVLGSSIEGVAVGGYNAKWNQKKPWVRMIAAGSAIVFTAQRDCASLPALVRIGQRQAEGLGRMLLDRLSAHDGFITAAGASAPGSVPQQADDLREKARMFTVAYARRHRERFGVSEGLLNPAFVGRLMRMAQESKSRVEFDGRLASIKSDSRRQRAMELLGITCRKSLDVPSTVEWTLEQECIVLFLVLGKYFAKQAAAQQASEVR